MVEDLAVFRRQHMADASATVSQGMSVPPEKATGAFLFFATSDSDLITGQLLAQHS